ncbi:MAG: amino acid adenylation domain-containing protein [Frankiaceae bacterium]
MTSELNVEDKRRAAIELRLRQKRVEWAERERIVPVPREGPLPVAEQQRYLWFLHQLAPDAPTYNMPTVLRLHGALDVAALGRSLRRLIARHESLRTRFVSDHGVPYQVIDPPPDEAPLEVADLTALPEGERWPVACAAVEAEQQRPFDLESGPIFRCWLGRLAPDDHVLLLVMHHIVSDGWSVGIVRSDLAALYAAERAGTDANLPALPVQPADYAAWQRRWLTGEALERQLAYWQERLTGAPAMELPADRPRPAAPTGAGAYVSAELPEGLGARVRELARAEQAPLLSVVLAAFALVLHRHARQDDLLVGSVLSGRTRSEVESMVGFFANTLVLRVDASGDPTFRELVARCNVVARGALSNQDVPFGTLVSRLQPERLPGRNPLFQISFTLLAGSIIGDFRFGDLAVEEVVLQLGTSRFDLGFQVKETTAGELSVSAEYSTELFDESRIQRLFERYRVALERAVDAPDEPLSRLPVITDAERTDLLESWNPEPAPHATDGSLAHEPVARMAVERPDAVAVRFEGEALAYGALDRDANRLAHLLTDGHGVGPDVVVGLLLERGPSIPTAQLAVMRAGGAWLPLDPVNPAGRIAFQMTDAAARVVLTTSDLTDLLPDGTPVLVLDDPEVQRRLAGLPGHAPRCAATADHLAYVMYTSGSTGRPKGVPVTHRSMVNYVTSISDAFAIAPHDRVLQFANPAFDASVFDVHATLARGATLVCAPRSQLHDPEALIALLRRERITVCHLPPAVLGLLDADSADSADSALPDLRALYVGAEAFPAELANRWQRPGRELVNAYGPTETTVSCIDYRCPDRPLTAPPPIGRPKANHRAYVLDKDGGLAPVGVPGELHVAGAGLARGYLGRPALTAERFVPCPFGPPGARMYATGDIVRWTLTGDLEFIGRADRQVKIRGLRIELGEIEHAMLRHEPVRQAVAALVTTGPAPELVAYVVPSGELDESALRAHLATELPLHMIPSSYVALSELPLMPSGKLDHARLPEPQRTAPSRHEPPRTETEQALAEIWQGLLDVPLERIGALDSFFALGGSSLQATQLASRIRDAFLVEVHPRHLFIGPALHQLAAVVDEARAVLVSEEYVAEMAEVAALSEEEVHRLLGSLDP